MELPSSQHEEETRFHVQKVTVHLSGGQKPKRNFSCLGPWLSKSFSPCFHPGAPTPALKRIGRGSVPGIRAVGPAPRYLLLSRVRFGGSPAREGWVSALWGAQLAILVSGTGTCVLSQRFAAQPILLTGAPRWPGPFPSDSSTRSSSVGAGLFPSWHLG